jgi:hypothetical protein
MEIKELLEKNNENIYQNLRVAANAMLRNMYSLMHLKLYKIMN